MFETTTTDGVPMMVRESFWQCMKAGLAFSLGALLLLPFCGLVLIVLGGSWATLAALLSLHH